MKHVLTSHIARLQSINSRVFCSVGNWVVIWLLECKMQSMKKTSGRSFGTMMMMVMTVVMMAAVSTEVALSKEDPVA